MRAISSFVKGSTSLASNKWGRLRAFAGFFTRQRRSVTGPITVNDQKLTRINPGMPAGRARLGTESLFPEGKP
jgi:hypothetical protein